MAMQHEVDMSTRRTALESFARAFGEHPPRDPIPEWWNHFERWFVGVRASPADQHSTKFLRTEAYGYDEIEEESDL